MLLVVMVLLPWDARAQAPAPSRRAATTARGASALVAEGALLLHDGKLDEAERRFEEALRLDPSLASAHFNAGLARERRKDYVGAEARYRETLALAPKDARAWDRLGFVLGLQGHTAEALSLFERATALSPTSFDAHYHLGATRWWTNRADLARAPLETAVQLDPKNADARYYLGLTLLQLGEQDAGIRSLRRAVSLAPGLAVAHERLGAALRESGDLDEAAASLAEALRLDPTRADAANTLGLVQMQRGEADAAVATFAALVARAPDNLTARHNLGTAYLQKGDLKAAVETFRDLVARDPSNAEGFYNLGAALKQQDDFAAAEQALRGGDPPPAGAARGALHARRRALADRSAPTRPPTSFRAALARKPSYADAHYMLGTVLRQAGKPDEALAEFRATLEHDPASAEAWISIGQVLQRHRDAEGSAEAFAEADRLRKEKADAQSAAFAMSTGTQKLAAGDVGGRAHAVPGGRSARAAEPAGALPARPRARARRPGGRGPCPLRRGAAAVAEAGDHRWAAVTPLWGRASALLGGIPPWGRASALLGGIPPWAGLQPCCAEFPRGAGLQPCCAAPAPRRSHDSTRPRGRSRADPVLLHGRGKEAGLAAVTVFGGREENRYLLETTGCGVALFDYDNDGWLDALPRERHDARGLSEGPGADEPPLSQPGRRHVRGRDRRGRARRQSGWGQGVCAGDYDNDGFEDLYVTYYGQSRLYRNTGRRHASRTSPPRPASPSRRPRWGTGCAFLDYDRDGQLDLFVANYIDLDLKTAPSRTRACAATRASRSRAARRGSSGGKNVLYRNRGDGTFEDVSDASGITKATGTYGLGVSTLDFDDDGWTDVYVANDSNPSTLYRNKARRHLRGHRGRGRLRLQRGRQDPGGHGRRASGDYDRNGTWTSSRRTSRATPRRSTPTPATASARTAPSRAASASTRRWLGWGAGFVDLDNDGWLDLFLGERPRLPRGAADSQARRATSSARSSTGTVRAAVSRTSASGSARR